MVGALLVPRWVDAAAATLPAFGVDLDWFTTRERDELEVLPWDHLDSGLDKDWLWQDWQDSLTEFEQDDCRWTPCFDCGVCPSMDTEIQIGPTGRSCCRSRRSGACASPDPPADSLQIRVIMTFGHAPRRPPLTKVHDHADLGRWARSMRETPGRERTGR